MDGTNQLLAVDACLLTRTLLTLSSAPNDIEGHVEKIGARWDHVRLVPSWFPWVGGLFEYGLTMS